MKKIPSETAEKKQRKPKKELESRSFRDGAIYLLFLSAAQPYLDGLCRLKYKAPAEAKVSRVKHRLPRDFTTLFPVPTSRGWKSDALSGFKRRAMGAFSRSDAFPCRTARLNDEQMPCCIQLD
jgi:hypothetical protein